MLRLFTPAILRVNLGEARALLQLDSREQGVDSPAVSSREERLEIAVRLARHRRTTVLLSGPEDIAADGSAAWCVTGGSDLMSKVTGTGCMLSVLCGVFAAVEPDRLSAAVLASAFWKVCSHRAEMEAGNRGPGSFRAALMDAAAAVTSADVAAEAQVERLRRSLREFGFVAPILIDEERRVIAGHGRLLAARAEGMESVPCVRVGDLTEAQRRAYILADNRLAEDAGWDEEALRFELDAIAALDFDVSLTGFDVDPGKPIHVREHDRAAAGEGEEPPDAEDDGYDGEIPDTCPYHPGDIFRLGRHLLVCGDCTEDGTTSIFQTGGQTSF